MQKITLCICFFIIGSIAVAQQKFNGIDANMGNIFGCQMQKPVLSVLKILMVKKVKAAWPQQALVQRASRDLGKGWKVSPSVVIKSKTTYTVAEIDGSGSIQHIWMTPTGNWRYSILRFYWDDETTPSVEVPVGDFFGMGWGQYSPLQSLAVCVNPGSAFNCYWPMPFRKKCRITMENIDDEGYGVVLPGRLYSNRSACRCSLFSCAVQTAPIHCLIKTDYVLVDSIKGRGQYVGTYMAWGVHNNGWWGEGEIKFFMDGDTEYPTICGTGTEDYFCGSYDFDTRKKNAAGVEDTDYTEFSTPYTGLHQVIRGDGHYECFTTFWFVPLAYYRSYSF